MQNARRPEHHDDPPANHGILFMHDLSPGAVVRHPQEPDWGLGHVQSVIGDRATVNFEHAGKKLINLGVVDLDLVERPRFS